MPTYDYQCNRCGYRFERFQKFSDAPVKTCPQCKGHVRRILHATGIVFKGSGWYITDSRKSSSASIEPKSEPKSEPASASTSEAAKTPPASGGK